MAFVRQRQDIAGVLAGSTIRVFELREEAAMRVRRLLTSLLTLLLVAGIASSAGAQEAVLAGTVTDTTGGVLPGVTITATNTATGNAFVAVTDGTGAYRLPVRVGTYDIRSELSGFQTVVQSGIQLLLGRDATVSFRMAPATLAETVTVTGEAPLIDTNSSTVGANIDPRQMQELPVNGRNWMDLTLLTPGARRNEAGGFVENRQGYFQTNVDGQQVTANYHSGGDDEQPQYSRDAIAEFEVVQNQFDASIGRSQGMVVNAITKSGTNSVTGSFGAYFRDSKFNAKDFIRHQVLPFQNQQVSTTIGGPIVRDRIHYFGSYEFERQPQTHIFNSPFPAFNRDLQLTDRVHKALARLDVQFTSQTRLSVRGSAFHNVFWAGGSATSHPSTARNRRYEDYQGFGTFTQVLGSSTVNEIKGGTFWFNRDEQQVVRWKGGAFPNHPVGLGGSPIIQLRGLTIGGSPLGISLPFWQARDDYATSFSAKGRHDLKTGVEYVRFSTQIRWCLRCDGQIDARGGPVPANIEELFPVWNDASTWNLAPLAPITRFVSHSLSPADNPLGPFRQQHNRNMYAAWLQDDWHTTDRLTLNLGVRYDFDDNTYSERVKFLPWMPGTSPHDTNNVAPRVGLNYQINDRTALHAGYGLFFSMAPNDGVHQLLGYAKARFEDEIQNDGRANFTQWDGNAGGFVGWFNGPIASYESAIQVACDINHNQPGCFRRSTPQEITYVGRRTPYSHQASFGIQRQIGADTSFQANYIYTGGRGEESGGSGQITNNANLTYDRATGANFPFTDISRRPFPEWGVINMEMTEGWSNYHGADFTLTKRFTRRWQATGTYTYSRFYDATAKPVQWFLGDDGIAHFRPVGFPLAADMGGDYALAAGDQRHHANINGIWDIGAGIQLSGLYFYGSGARFATDTGVDRRDQGSSGEQRLRADGTVAPRNNLTGDPIHRVDMRLQKRIRLGGNRALEGILEVFNLFNHANYGSYVTNESSGAYGSPSFNSNIAYQARMMQLGFRIAF
jgi:outer membrane receptor protein involved in Fe transport